MGPIKFIWIGGHMIPAGPFWARLARKEFGEGEEVELERWEERSIASHRHEFAWVKRAWDSLPDSLLAQFPSPEHLRKFALVKTGHCTMQQYPCGSAAEAQRWAINLRPIDPYAIVTVDGSVVTVWHAKSQSSRAMPKSEFQQSKEDILRYVAELLHVDAFTLAGQGEAP